MIDRHLTDEQVQSYLDGSRPCNRDWIETHLEVCEQCREELAQYRQLYFELERDVGFELPREFADSVISTIPEPVAAAKESRFIPIFTSISGAIAALGVFLYLVGPGPLLVLCVSIYEYLTSLFVSFSGSLLGLLYALNLDTHLLLYVAIVVSLILLLDQAYLHKGKPALRTK